MTKEPKIRICPKCDGDYLDGEIYVEKVVHNIFLIEYVKVRVCLHCYLRLRRKQSLLNSGEAGVLEKED